MNDPNPIDDESRAEPISNIEAVFRIFLEVSEAPLEEQESMLESLCSDVSQRQRIRAMLEADSSEDSFLDHSLIPDADEIRKNDEIENFKLLDELGRGGMGVVFLAEQIKPIQRTVALKVIKPGVDSKDVIARFEAERHALSLMEHPNIAMVLDAGTTRKRRPFFVMELVDGQPITDYCQQKGLSVHERLELFIPVCRAIQHAHQKGVIHRDIKPSNVLVTEFDGQPLAKVIDFGVAKATNQSLIENPMDTVAGQIVGTFDYMSPEQSRTGDGDVDTRSDIYSLGVLLYELLTGTPPFEKERLRSSDWEDMLRIVREEDPPKPSARIATLSQLELRIKYGPANDTAKLFRTVKGELDWIVLKAIEKDRVRRYATPNELANDIQCFLVGDDVSACPPSKRYRFLKFAKRNKVAIATTAIVAASLILGMISTTLQATRASRAEQALQQASDFLAQDLIGLAGPESQLSTELQPNPNLQLLIFLNRLLDRVEHRFKSHEQVKANLKAALSRSFNIMGRHEDASQLCREYWEYLEESKGRDHPDTIRVKRQLVRFYIDDGKLIDASSLIHKALEDSGKVLGDEHEVTLNLKTDFADLLHKQGKLQASVDTHLACLAIKKRVLGEDRMETLLSQSNLASVYESLGRYDDAEQLLRQVLEANEQRQDAHKQLRVAASLNNLAKCFLKRGRSENDESHFVEAETHLNAALEMYPDTLEIKKNLALTYLEMGRFNEAEPYLIELEEGTRNLSGPNDLTTLESLNMLGWCYLHQNRLPEAEYVLSNALDSLKQYHPDDSLLLRVMENLAFVYQGIGKYQASIALDETAVELRKSQLDEDSDWAMELKTRLGLSYIQNDRVADGRTMLESVFRESDFRVAGILARSYLDEEVDGGLLPSGTGFEKSRFWTQRQLESGRKALGPDSVAFGRVSLECGLRQLRMNLPDEAEITFRNCLQIFDSMEEEQAASFELDGIEVKLLLSEALAMQTKYREAGKFLNSAYRQLSSGGSEISDEQNLLLLTAVDQLIGLSVAQGDDHEARNWRKTKTEMLATLNWY